VKTKTKQNNLFRGSEARGIQRTFIGVVTMGLLILSCALNARAQQITGSIVGTVKDEQGAVVSGAAVKATNVDTGFSRLVTTAGDGAYRIEYLPVGKYDVAVEMQGFQKFVQQNIVLAVDQTQALNVTLAVGASSQTVTVTAAPALVDTASAVLGRTVQPAEIIGLPLVNRNAYAELSLTPGVQSNSASGATNASNSNPNGTPNYQIGVPSTQVVVNGGIDGGVPMVSFFLDGGSNMTASATMEIRCQTRMPWRSFA
jgi:carboxypeptidase family protein